MPADTFTILGSSAGMPQADRASSGYALTVGGRHTIIDCGGGVASSFLRRGLNPHDIDRIIISHTHPDHCCELALFIQMIHLSGRGGEVAVYVPDEFVAPFETYLNAVYLIREKLSFNLHLEGYADRFTLNSGFMLTAYENSHFKHNAELIERLGLPNRMQCHSILIATGDKRLLYSADIGTFDDIRPLLDGCDYVVMETTHIDLDAFIAYARTGAVGRFVLTHLNGVDDVDRLNSRLQEAGIDNYLTAIDGLELPL